MLELHAVGPCKYTLLIDGHEAGTYDDVQLEHHIELQENPNTPQYQQALAVANLNKRGNEGPIDAPRTEWWNFQDYVDAKRELQTHPDSAKAKQALKAAEQKVVGMDRRIAKDDADAKVIEDNIFKINKPPLRSLRECAKPQRRANRLLDDRLLDAGCWMLAPATPGPAPTVNPRIAPGPRRLDSILALRDDARFRNGVLAIGIWHDRRGAFHRQLVDGGGELVLGVEHVVECDDPTGVGGHATHRGHQAGFDAALDFIVGRVLADGVDEIVPFVLVRVVLFGGELGFPNQVRRRGCLALVSGRRHADVAVVGNHRRAFGPVRERVVDLRAAIHAAAVHDESGSVGEHVFDAIDVEVLVDVLAAIVAPADRLGLDRPGVFIQQQWSMSWM